MVNRPKAIGTAGERATVAYLRGHGFPHAERRALAGTADLGDVVGCPGLVVEIKSGKAAEQASDGLVSDWLAETETERQHAAADLGILVLKRAGYGPSRAASWWAVFQAQALAALLGAPTYPPADSEPVRMHLSTAVQLLRAAGYGDALPLDADLAEVAR